ncbi:hypothetical protein HHK36_008949 [Tetracentron sinense]|uniref:Aspartic proteinase Asp1 n=1 Tax=Tetracentron sinense TaxID=13715 RepID=A0A835DKK8_TETSI|nr:hypothetical protein HHK36_008949 [Tetracentron sinense]
MSILMGDPPKQYHLDIDTGSDLTWLQCDVPGAKLTPAPRPFYRPNNKNFIRCKDPICVFHHSPENPHCETQEQCDYDIEYADHSSSMGLLVKDVFTLPFTDKSRLSPHLFFGCGYSQEVVHAAPHPHMDGVLGLSNGKSSIVSQLHNQGLIRKVIGHCISGQGEGFLFFGQDLVPPPSSGVVWTPMSDNSDKHYMSGPAELKFGGKPTGVKGLSVIFDSGSSYTYFNSIAYEASVSLVKSYLYRKPLTEALDERALRVCWKGAKPFKSISDVKKYFKPILLSFGNGVKTQLEIPPEAYLVITSHGNVCLGILNGTEAKLDNLNVIGDISLQDKMVIYDNENQQIGWITANCDKLLKSKNILL